MKNLIKTIVLIFVACMFTVAFAGCSDNGSGTGGGGNGNQNVTVSGHVRDASFADLSTDIYYDGEVCGKSDANGSFIVEIPHGYELSKLKTDGESVAFRTYSTGGEFTEILKLNEGEKFSATDFYALSGKIVLHSDGESAASGVELRIDGNTVLTTSDNRNFDLLMVHKNSVISVFKQCCAFVDRFGDEYNNICFSEKLADITEKQEVEINGEKISLTHLTGVTFRLNDINI